MSPSSPNPSHQGPSGYPADWSEEVFLQKWEELIMQLIQEHKVTLPLRRVRAQVEGNAHFADTRQRWSRMNASERLICWKGLLESCERHMLEVLPACVQCGECCRLSSPTLQLEDLDLLKYGRIPWSALVTLRAGEPVRSPYEDRPMYLTEDRIKIREKEGGPECVFFDGATFQCLIYANRPIQCRAQACWDPSPARKLADQPSLTRLELFEGADLLMDVIDEHNRRCSFAKLHDAFKRLEETQGETIGEVLDLLAYEDHFRHFMGGKLRIPEESLDLVFGRSLAALVPLFGYRVVEESDGTRCLVPDESGRE